MVTPSLNFGELSMVHILLLCSACSVLQGYESRLVETALSESDASTIIANCLHFIAQDSLS